MKAPKNLKKVGKKFWKQVLQEFSLTDSHDLERLTLACTCLDAIDAAQEQIEQDGAFIADRYGAVKEHPAGKVIRENKIIFVRIVRELCLDVEEPVESRIPRRY